MFKEVRRETQRQIAVYLGSRHLPNKVFCGRIFVWSHLTSVLTLLCGGMSWGQQAVTRQGLRGYDGFIHCSP